jgi:2-dehydro-3-deoxygluconokinase
VATVTSIDPDRHVDMVTLGETLALLQTTGVAALRHARELQLSVGGSESNVAIGMARLGRKARWVGRVGDDELGERVLREIRAEGVEAHGVIDPDAPTALMIKEQRNSEQLRVTYYRRGSAGSRLQPSDLPDGWVSGAKILHITGITPGLSTSALNTVQKATETARANGTVISLDLNYRRALWDEHAFGGTLRELVPVADIVFGSPHEVTHVVGRCGDSLEAQLEAVAKLGPGQVVLKLGAEGALALVHGALYRQDAFSVEVVDTVGAGDAFVAGWLAELVSQPDDVGAWISTAAACGAYACTVPGDWEGAPSRRDVDSMIKPPAEAVHR